MSYHSLARFLEEHVVVGTDLGTVTTDGGMSGVPAATTFGRSSRMDVTADRARACFAYSTANGILANFSINGGPVSCWANGCGVPQEAAGAPRGDGDIWDKWVHGDGW